MKQSMDGDKIWKLAAAGTVKNMGGLDHTTLSGEKSIFTISVLFMRHQAIALTSANKVRLQSYTLG